MVLVAYMRMCVLVFTTFTLMFKKGSAFYGSFTMVVVWDEVVCKSQRVG